MQEHTLMAGPVVVETDSYPQTDSKNNQFRNTFKNNTENRDQRRQNHAYRIKKKAKKVTQNTNFLFQYEGLVETSRKDQGED